MLESINRFIKPSEKHKDAFRAEHTKSMTSWIHKRQIMKVTKVKEKVKEKEKRNQMIRMMLMKRNPDQRLEQLPNNLAYSTNKISLNQLMRLKASNIKNMLDLRKKIIIEK